MTTVEVDDRRLVLTNLDKVLWPESGLTKGSLIEYYTAVAPALLPHLADRPLTLRRFPDGIDANSWHQNECRGEPDWFRVFEHRGRGGRTLRFCVVDGLPALVWVANQAAVELHPFLWRTTAPRRPTQLVLDLDPGAPAGLLDCALVARRARELLEEIGLPSYAKTSGSLGIHVHAPVEGKLDTKSVGRELARILAAERPSAVTSEMRLAARAGKVYVDWLQNDPTRQTVAPYSLRGVPGAFAATPVTWDELERACARRRPDDLRFTGEDVLRRLDRHGDLFAPLC